MSGRRRQRGARSSGVNTAVGTPPPLFAGSPSKQKQYSYTVEIQPTDADAAVVETIISKLKGLQVGQIAWKQESIVSRVNNFGETTVQGSFTTVNRPDSDEVEENIEDWGEVESVTVTRSVVEFKISKEPVQAPAADPLAAGEGMRRRRPSLKSIAGIVQLSTSMGPGAQTRTRNRVRAPPTPANDKLSESQRKKKAKAARKQERAEALALLQKLLAVHTEQIKALRRRLLDEDGRMRELDRVTITGLSVTNSSPILVGQEMRVKGIVETNFYNEDSSTEDGNNGPTKDADGETGSDTKGKGKDKDKGNKNGPQGRPLSDAKDGFIWYREPGQEIVSEVRVLTSLRCT